MPDFSGQRARHPFSLGVFRIEATSRIFAYLDEDVDKYFAELEAEKAADILEEMDADDAIDILEELDKKKADEIISLIEPESKSDIQLLRSYKDNEFGSLMTTNYITLEYGIGIKKSIEQLIEEAEENDNIETLYIIKDNKFYGALTLRDQGHQPDRRCHHFCRHRRTDQRGRGRRKERSGKGGNKKGQLLPDHRFCALIAGSAQFHLRSCAVCYLC